MTRLDKFEQNVNIHKVEEMRQQRQKQILLETAKMENIQLKFKEGGEVLDFSELGIDMEDPEVYAEVKKLVKTI
jgi:hypothetical protein